MGGRGVVLLSVIIIFSPYGEKAVWAKLNSIRHWSSQTSAHRTLKVLSTVFCLSNSLLATIWSRVLIIHWYRRHARQWLSKYVLLWQQSVSRHTCFLLRCHVTVNYRESKWQSFYVRLSKNIMVLLWSYDCLANETILGPVTQMKLQCESPPHTWTQTQNFLLQRSVVFGCERKWKLIKKNLSEQRQVCAVNTLPYQLGTVGRPSEVIAWV